MSGAERDILLIEDNPGDVRLIEELLTDATGPVPGSLERTADSGVDLQHADRLAAGLDRLDDASIDVVLLDLGLPDSRGIETLEAVLAETRELPIVVLTGLDDERVGVEAVQQGAQEYLVKNELTPKLLGRSIRHAIERKKFERTQRALHDASRALIQAESKDEVGRLTVDAAADVLDVAGIVVYLFDEAANELRPAATTPATEAIFGDVPTYGPDDDSTTWRAFITGESLSLPTPNDDPAIESASSVIRSGVWIPLGDHGVVVAVSAEADAIDQQTERTADHLAATAEAALERVEREESLLEHERELTERNAQLQAVNRMNEIIRDIDQVLVQATTREAIEDAVCERLTSDERFAFAWVGEAAGDVLRPRSWAGEDQGYLDAISLSIDDGDGPPGVTTGATGRATVEANVAADLRGAAWRTAALSAGLQSVVSVPLTYNDLSYGVLTVFGSDPGAIDDETATTFEELGDTIANAINAAETRQALLTDSIVELRLAMTDPDDLLGRLARRANCAIEYDGIVPQTDGSARVYVYIDGVDETDLRPVADDLPNVKTLARVGEDGGDPAAGRFELTVTGPTIPWTLVECGAIARSIEVTAETADVVAELPDTTDVRAFVDRLDAIHPGTELVARRDRDRLDRSRETFEDALTDELTERQLETLRTAYRSGYFEWPRERTGEEVAASLDITQPTFNGHLRTAERKLCRRLFDGGRLGAVDVDQRE
ncbi:bacterio-opsin activator domain-containing protein [Halovivax limisalsi]|uniref:bacterio-opsin activator domain-containing protein n=1 Tax=Halovivax limisalsi TaxID=1453760 RepID=UPI001FFD399F|nr:bacterio-opsin activator domain-containing protein [Halovivax limisalsi]